MPLFPLIGEPSPAFDVVRTFFRETGYDAATLCRALSIADMSSVGDVKWAEDVRRSLPVPLQLCVDLFLRGLRVPTEAIHGMLPAAVVEAFETLGMVRAAKQVEGASICPAWVYPVGDFVVASDRRDPPDDTAFAPGNEVVFPAIYGLTRRFLEMLPASDGCDVLDLCGGAGIAAMIMARAAQSAVSADLSPRATDFATFNARLNDIAIESVCGDLYEPTAGRTFDVITAHPPFVPDLGEHVTFRDGGEAGEDIIRNIIRGLPASLRTGGTCMIVCWARDTEGAPFEQRVADWLDADRDGFDVVFGLEKVRSTEEIVADMRQFRHVTSEDLRGLRERLERLHTSRFVYGALWIRRLSAEEKGTLKPLRIGIDRSAESADFAPLLAWRRERRRPEFTARLLRSKPKLAPGLELVARYAVRDAELVPNSFTFSTEAPFRCGARVDAWMVPVFARFKGCETVANIHRAAVAAGEVPDGFPLEALVGFVTDGVEKGLLVVDLES